MRIPPAIRNAKYLTNFLLIIIGPYNVATQDVPSPADISGGKLKMRKVSHDLAQWLLGARFLTYRIECRLNIHAAPLGSSSIISPSELTYRLYRGTETQQPDSLILAKEGAGNAPAYRGTAYIVFERMPVTDFGNRLPQLSFEVHRAAGGAERHVRAVNIIPGSTEFGYDTTVVAREAGDGITENENAHAASGRSDWTVSIDDLTATCPNLTAASLVVAWFGTDLRCGQTQIRPGVENTTKTTSPVTWRVSNVDRDAAHVVSSSGGGPAYGGTPSDAAVIRAIRDLNGRGLKTVFYPFILMRSEERRVGKECRL